MFTANNQFIIAFWERLAGSIIKFEGYASLRSTVKGCGLQVKAKLTKSLACIRNLYAFFEISVLKKAGNSAKT